MYRAMPALPLCVILFCSIYLILTWIERKPTADQLYGCTYQQTDPASGECK
jgi:hypothetical protein